MSMFGAPQTAPAPPPPPAMLPAPIAASAAPQAAAAASGQGKITITPEMSEKLSPRWPLPKASEADGGTERRSVDPMKLRADNEQVESGEKLMQQMKARYGEPEQ